MTDQIFVAGSSKKSFSDFETIETEFLVTDRSLIKIPIYESPLYLCKVLKKEVYIPGPTRLRHLYSG